MEKRDMVRLRKQLNTIRVICNIDGGSQIDDLPQGIREDADNCPIAMALSNGVEPEVNGTNIYLTFPRGTDTVSIVVELERARFRNVWRRDSREIVFNTTSPMRTFIKEFDSGQLKEYVKGNQ